MSKIETAQGVIETISAANDLFTTLTDKYQTENKIVIEIENKTDNGPIVAWKADSVRQPNNIIAPEIQNATKFAISPVAGDITAGNAMVMEATVRDRKKLWNYNF